jgi:hypothetical protein
MWSGLLLFSCILRAKKSSLFAADTIYCAREYSLLLLKLPFAAAGLALPPELSQSPQSSPGLPLPAAPAALLPSAELLLFLLLLLLTLTCTAEGGGGVKGRPSAAAFTFSR